MHPLFKKYKLKHLSASQVKTFKRSPFTWICEKVLGMRSPGSEATTFGSYIHKNFENWMGGKDLSSYEIPEDCEEFYHDEWKTKLDKFFLDYMALKPKNEKTIALESDFVLEVHKDLPPFIGYIDVLTETLNDDGSRIEVIVEDHKTIGNKQFAPKTPEDLLKEDQLMIYAEVMFQKYCEFTKVCVRHNQLFKKIKRKPVNLLQVEVDRDMCKKRLKKIGKDALGMIEALKTFEEKGIEGVAAKYKKEYEKTKFDFGGCKLYPFFMECLNGKKEKLNIKKSENTKVEDNEVKDLHEIIGQAREHFEKDVKTKFELADKITDSVVLHIREENITSVFIRQGGSNGDLVMNQTLNQLAENGVKIYERIF